jgi:hypothetical protein
LLARIAPLSVITVLRADGELYPLSVGLFPVLWVAGAFKAAGEWFADGGAGVWASTGSASEAANNEALASFNMDVSSDRLARRARAGHELKRKAPLPVQHFRRHTEIST